MSLDPPEVAEALEESRNTRIACSDFQCIGQQQSNPIDPSDRLSVGCKRREK